MKFLKITSIALMCVVLFGCDNSNKVKAPDKADLTKLQDLIISEAKKVLPAKVDSKTSLVDIFKDNDVINYRYIINVSKDSLQIPETEKMTTESLKKVYCSDNQQIKEFRGAFPNGAVHSYYINDEKIFSVTLTPASCNTN
ncbi:MULTISPECIES: hypothetical protein [unclassified Gilliamella]|uniref:hypothetical protein n=1 Tax=unclassified Gilliamella TaxID=2685620 RepID=UPI00226A6481|nr:MULTISPECIES: hypothetical protein [unclassified Gilliamella]MCX8641972.1 hypothetical protein [Gilliamella sp. B3835]MCX8706901.1 hypothetical protein [Gilliamella sp. B3783]MCX8708760.1 hypothetical protein [Gilliamella sp. B3780]MCX8710957.1 hypothetical protein [Gilliamella sp. B3468]MCX8713543.1 hypothetical protein [Gilliamella sp. B3781]